MFTKNKLLPDIHWKSFVISFIGVFLLVFFQHVGVTVPRVTITIPQKEDIFSNIRKQLTSIPNDYHLETKAHLIPQSHASEDYEAAAAYAVVNYETGEIIASKNLSTRLPIASLTKIMTSVVTLDLASPDELFTISEYAASQIPTKIGVLPGEEMSVRELLHAALLTSANDAVEVLREGVNTKYRDDVFIKAMNIKAEHVGLKNTSFDNPQGFDGSENFSSVEDLSILTHYAMTNYPLFAEIAKKDFEFVAQNDFHKQFDLYNWNGLINVYPNVSGVKIGNTERAGKTTVVLSEREGMKVLVVLLGAPGVLERDMWAAQLLDLGFQELGNLQPVAVTKEALYAKYDTWEFWN